MSIRDGIIFNTPYGEEILIKHKGKGGGLSYDEYRELIEKLSQKGCSPRQLRSYCEDVREGVCAKKDIIGQGSGLIYNAFVARSLLEHGIDVVLESRVVYNGSHACLNKLRGFTFDVAAVLREGKGLHKMLSNKLLLIEIKSTASGSLEKR